MTIPVPDHFALYALGAGVLLALVAVAIGAGLLMVRARAFAERLDGYAELPLFSTVELTEARLDIASRSLESVPQLGPRLQRVLAQFSALRPERRARAARNPEN